MHARLGMLQIMQVLGGKGTMKDDCMAFVGQRHMHTNENKEIAI